jgi:hypothetical protein
VLANAYNSSTLQTNRLQAQAGRHFCSPAVERCEAQRNSAEPWVGIPKKQKPHRGDLKTRITNDKLIPHVSQNRKRQSNGRQANEIPPVPSFVEVPTACQMWDRLPACHRKTKRHAAAKPKRITNRCRQTRKSATPSSTLRSNRLQAQSGRHLFSPAVQSSFMK